MRGPDTIKDLVAALSDRTQEARIRLSATTLARIGTPTAVEPLLTLMSELPDSELKDDVSHIVSTITNAEAADCLFRWFISTEDVAVRGASEYSLARMVNKHLLSKFWEAVSAFPLSTPYERFLSLVRNLASPAAEEALLSWVGPTDAQPTTDLGRSALFGLGQIGTATATNALLQRLDSTSSDDTGDTFTAVTQVAGSDEAIAALRYVAQGNKVATRDHARVAAIYGLARFPDGETTDLLRVLLDDPSPLVRDAARQGLEKLRVAE
jgi:HEAT repeat protein